MSRSFRPGLAIALALITLPVHASDPATTEQLLARIAALEQRLAAVEAANAATAATIAPDALDQRLRVIERRQELDAEADAGKAAAAPVLAINDKGLFVPVSLPRAETTGPLQKPQASAQDDESEEEEDLGVFTDFVEGLDLDNLLGN